MMARILAGVRVSRITDESTSPERQEATIRKWAASLSHEVVGTAIDLDESAYKVPPLARPELGAWLKNKTEDFDIVAWSRLDRAVRRMADMSDLVRWAKDHRKTLAFCSGPGGTLILDMSSGLVSELIAQVLAFAAEMEAYSIQERQLDARSALRQLKRYGGGWTPFGYRPVEQDAGWQLAPDPEYAPMLNEIVNSIIDGSSVSDMAAYLNDRKVPTSKDVVRMRSGLPIQKSKWTPSDLMRMLRSNSLRGVTTYGGEIVRGREDGLPVRFADPVIDDLRWARLQHALDERARPRGRPTRTSPFWVGQTFCALCGRPMYSATTKSKHAVYEYARCRGLPSGECKAKLVQRGALETAINAWMEDIGSTRMHMEQGVILGNDNSAEIKEVTEAIGHYSQRVAIALAYGQDAANEQAMLTSLQARLTRLAKEAAEPALVVYRQSGESEAQHWAKLDARGKRDMLATEGIKFHVFRPEESNEISVEIDAGNWA